MRDGYALIGLVIAVTVGAMAPAEFFGCNDRPGQVLSYDGHRYTHEFAAQASRPRITIHPRRVRPGPNATRHCRSWLAREYRVSGPVIVPRQRCWWQ